MFYDTYTCAIDVIYKHNNKLKTNVRKCDKCSWFSTQ